MGRVLEYAHTCGIPVLHHAIGSSLVENGYMNEGEVATRIGLRGLSGRVVIQKRDQFAQAIRFTHSDQSVSSLFKVEN